MRKWYQSQNKLVYYPATSQQRDNWRYHNQLPGHQAHQIVEVDGFLEDLVPARLEKAFGAMVKKHESLRTFLMETADGLCQCVAPYETAAFTPFFYDVSTQQNMEPEVRRLLDHHRRRLSRMNVLPLVECVVFQISDTSSYVSILIHHIIADEWSRILIYKELSGLYQQLENLETPELPLPVLQLGEYASWQKNWLEKNGSAISAYWRDKFEDIPPTFSCTAIAKHFNGLYNVYDSYAHFTPLEVQAMVKTGEAATYTANIGMPLYQRLAALAAQCNATMGAVLYTSLQLLFYKLTHRNRVLLAMPVIDRGRPGAEGIIGCLTGGIYLYHPIDVEKRIEEFVTDTYAGFLEAMGHIIYNHDELNVDGQKIRFCTDVYVNFLSKEVTGSGTAEIDETRRHEAFGVAEYYALSYCISEFANGLMCVWKYNKQLYQPAIMEYMAAEHINILHDMCNFSGLTLQSWMKKDEDEACIMYL